MSEMGDKIKNDLTVALKAGEAEKVSVLRMLMAALHNAEIEKRGKSGTAELAAEEETTVLSKEMKKRKEAAELYRQGGRAELAEKEMKEAEIIAAYLPSMVGREEIEKVVDEVMYTEKGEFGVIMKQVMGKLKGVADGKEVAAIIKERLK